jgi:hypothetical protein
VKQDVRSVAKILSLPETSPAVVESAGATTVIVALTCRQRHTDRWHGLPNDPQPCIFCRNTFQVFMLCDLELKSVLVSNSRV